MIRPILRHPHPVLRAPCTPVGAVTDAVRSLAADMLETMYAAPGRGLAAPQIGVSLRVFVMDPGWKDGTPAPLVAVDPEFTALGAETASDVERCLSIPDISICVRRAARIRLDFTDLDGSARSTELTGFAAACAQHEVDHLDGILTLDRAVPDAGAQAAPSAAGA